MTPKVRVSVAFCQPFAFLFFVYKNIPGFQDSFRCWSPFWVADCRCGWVRERKPIAICTPPMIQLIPPPPIVFLVIFFEGGRRGQTRCIIGDVQVANCIYYTKHKYRFKMKRFLSSWWVHGNNESRQSFCHSSLVNEKATGWLIVVLSVFFLFLLCMYCARFECPRNNFVTLFSATIVKL